MKKHFVKTSNWNIFQANLAAMENRGSDEACIMLLSGEPASGKTKALDKYGADRGAVLLEGMPDMSVTFLRDYIADRIGVNELRKYRQFDETLKWFRESRAPIILDEAQHAAEGKAKPLEYLRRIAEKAQVMLILACHSSETNKFTEHRLAHINTRITAAPVFRPATKDDCALYLKELCEVSVDDGIVQMVMEQSSGRYRLINNAIKSLETLAHKAGKASMTAADIKGSKLCENAMRGAR